MGASLRAGAGDDVTDAELELWLTTGSVVVIGTQSRLPYEGALGRYDPCRAEWEPDCPRCPYERCEGPIRAS